MLQLILDSTNIVSSDLSIIMETQGWDPVWEQIFSTREWGKYPPEHVVRFVAGNFYRVPDRKEMCLLEVGCGPGANIWFMAREGFTVSRIDGSATSIKQGDGRLVRCRFFYPPLARLPVRRCRRECQSLSQSLGRCKMCAGRNTSCTQAGCAVPVVILY